jgi:hypothetical protein
MEMSIVAYEHCNFPIPDVPESDLLNNTQSPLRSQN